MLDKVLILLILLIPTGTFLSIAGISAWVLKKKQIITNPDDWQMFSYIILACTVGLLGLFVYDLHNLNPPL